MKKTDRMQMNLNPTQKTMNRLFWHLWETELRLNTFTWAIENEIPIPKKELTDAKKWCRKSGKLLVETDIVSFLNLI